MIANLSKVHENQRRKHLELLLSTGRKDQERKVTESQDKAYSKNRDSGKGILMTIYL